MKQIFFTVSLLAACAEAEDARLDHAQILAVRAEPANVAPGERARIDILAGDSEGNVFETAPDTLAAFGSQGPLAVERTDDGWFVTAGATPEIATLAVELAIEEETWPAVKSLVVGQQASNPLIAMTVDGTAAAEMSVDAGTKPTLGVDITGTGPFTYAWYSSVGDLRLYRSESAELDAASPAEGTLVVVVRDDVGGVAWQIVPARVD